MNLTNQELESILATNARNLNDLLGKLIINKPNVDTLAAIDDIVARIKLIVLPKDQEDASN